MVLNRGEGETRKERGTDRFHPAAFVPFHRRRAALDGHDWTRQLPGIRKGEGMHHDKMGATGNSRARRLARLGPSLHVRPTSTF